METNISKLSNGLYEVKPKGDAARCFYTKAQAQIFLENFNSSNLQPLTNDTVQIAPRKKHTWSQYAQEHGTTYTKPPKSGAVIADERAAQIIAKNAEEAAQQATTASATTSTAQAAHAPKPPKATATATTAPAAHAPKPPKAPATATTTQAVHAPKPKATTSAVATSGTQTSQIQATLTRIMESIKETAKKGIEAIEETAGKATEKIKETGSAIAEKAKKPTEKLTETTSSWWKSLQSSIEKNPGKWGIGAAGVALTLLLLSSLGGSDKNKNNI